MSIGYVTVCAHNVEAALPFFDPALGAIGYERGEPSGGGPFYGPKRGRALASVYCKPPDGPVSRGWYRHYDSF